MNVHPTGGLQQLLSTLEGCVMPIKSQVTPQSPFGLGLWIPGLEATGVLQEVDRFKAFLQERDLYVFTMNGFPYGRFHNTRVKDGVHHPDWRTRERVEYTINLARILVNLLPEGVDGTISTSPLSYRPWVEPMTDDFWEVCVNHLVEVAFELHQLHAQHDKRVMLCLEPEPDGVLGCTSELLDFVEGHLMTRGVQLLASKLGMLEDDAKEVLFTHIGGCVDTCHLAVGFERPLRALQRYQQVGFQIGKIQLSSALKAQPSTSVRQALRTLQDDTYLHQVAALQAEGEVRRFPDLRDALNSSSQQEALEWRVHFHVPVFLEKHGILSSTQTELLDVLQTLPLWQCKHLEVETYTWQVLPPELQLPITESISRELKWVRDVLS